MVTGSNPVRRTISQENPIKPWFVEALEYQNTTLLQLYKEFIKTDTTYLQKIKNIYYLVYKYKGKVIKKSLRSSNLKYCNIQKLKMIQVLKKELGLGFNKITDDMLTITIQANKGDSPEAVEKVKQEAIKEASKQLGVGDIKTIVINEPAKISIKEAFEKFINNLKNKKTKVSESTLQNYDSAMSYIKLFIDKNENISKLDSRFWNYLQEMLVQTPRDYTKTPALLKKGIEKSIIDNEKMKNKLQNEIKNAKNDIKKIDSLRIKYEDIILKTLSNTTTNKHFSCYNKFMEYLTKNDYMDNTIKVDALDEEDSDKETFLYKELKELFNYESKRKSSYKNEEYQNIFKFAFLSGMRRGEILKIRKEHIVEANGILCIDIKEAKNKQSIRLVPISKDMKKIIDIQFKKSKNGYLFFDKEIRVHNTDEAERTIGKRLNRIIDALLIKNGYADKSVKSFHSLRGNFIQECYKQLEEQNIGSELYIKMLVGHKAIKNITFNTYNKSQVSIDILSSSIENIRLDLINNSMKENIIIKKAVDFAF